MRAVSILRDIPPPPASGLRILGYVTLGSLFLLASGLLVRQYDTHLANLILIQAIAAIGVNIIMGYAGLVSMAYAATMAAGAYTSVLVMTKLGLPFAVAFPAAVLVAGLTSAMVGVLGTRVGPIYFLVITVGVHVITFLFILNEAWLTGGPVGIFDVPPAAIGPWIFDTDRRFLALAVVSFMVALYLAQRLRHSRDGRAMFAVRLNETAAASSGVPVARYRVVAMLIGGMYLGAAGSLFAHVVGFLGTESFGLSLALQLTLVVVVGGIGSNVGAAVSAGALMLFTAQFRQVGATWVLLYGLLIMVLIIVAPRGLAGASDTLARYLNRRLPTIAFVGSTPPTDGKSTPTSNRRAG